MFECNCKIKKYVLKGLSAVEPYLLTLCKYSTTLRGIALRWCRSFITWVLCRVLYFCFYMHSDELVMQN